MNLQGKRVAVVGMARSGIGAAKLIQRLGGTALISDIKQAHELTSAIEELQKFGIEVETGSHQKLQQEKFDLIVLSPGVVVKPDLWHIWNENQLEVISELELASRFCKSDWIGVTGSNGKTTTVNLISQILLETNRKVELVGNVGNAWSNFLPDEMKTDFVVEISSFQLENSPTVKPKVGVILNIFENHLDRHGTIENYAEIKSRLLKNQSQTDVAVLNGDDSRLQSLQNHLKSKIVWFGSQANHDFSVSSEGLSYKNSTVSNLFLKKNDFPLIGQHNALNAAAAAATAYSFGIDIFHIANALKKAKPVEHRIEFVREINGIQYINDSKSTNLMATLTALEAFPKNVILLFGGRAKKESFAPLSKKYPNPIKTIISYGESRKKLKDGLAESVPMKETDTLQDALSVAQKLAVRGDVVLLSPGCASYDQFDNFEQRGELFKNLVHQL